MANFFDSYDNQNLLGKLHKKQKLAGLVIFAEMLVKALWRIASWILLFFGLWLLQIPSIAGSFGDITAAFAFWGGLFYLLKSDLKGIAWPSATTINKRLEEASGFRHRPLATVTDRLANPDKERAKDLWQIAQNQASEKITAIKLPHHRPQLVQKDPYALRMLVIFLFIVGVAVSGGYQKHQIAHGLFPVNIGSILEKNLHTTIWITPPEYTYADKIVIEHAEGFKDILSIPDQSKIKFLVHGGFFTPKLHVGETEHVFKRHDDKNWVLSMPVPNTKNLIVKQSVFTRLNIALAPIADSPPTVRLDGDPETLQKGQLRIPVAMYDDYGVIDLTMRMTLDPMIDDAPLGRDVEEIRSVMSMPNTEVKLQNIYDLSWHSWAGLPAIITFEVIDHMGQTALSEPLEVKLPEREFQHPVAKKLVDIRKRLAWTPKEAAGNAAYDLETLLMQPDSFQNDMVVFLGLRSAASRLIISHKDEDVTAVINLLWQLALRIEDGNLPLASSRLHAARQKLEQLLRDPEATDEEIAEAAEEFRMAMAEYMREMVRELQKQAKDGRLPIIPPDAADRVLSPDALAQFLDKMQAEALTGDREAAQRMLSELGQLMDNLNPSLSQKIPPEMQFMDEAVNELQELIEKQQELLDRTQDVIGEADISPAIQEQKTYPDFLPFVNPPGLEWKELLPPPPQERLTEEEKAAKEKLEEQAKAKGADTKESGTQQAAVDTSEHAGIQEGLRYILGELMTEASEVLGEIPEGMQLAEQDMRRSKKSLTENDPQGSVPHQELAIKHLQEGMDSMSQQLQEMMKKMNIVGLGGIRRDPLGRPMPNQFGNNQSGSRIEIPDEAERKRVQDILDTLRKKSGELERPEYELDYYRRLMKQF